MLLFLKPFFFLILNQFKNMKHFFSTLILLLSIALSMNAQITITSTDMPSSNDTVRFSQTDLDTLTISIANTSGANVTWDFSHLEATNQAVASYVSALQTPYSFFFFGLNKYGRLQADTIGFGQFQFTDVYQFFNKSSSKLEIEGLGLKYQGLPIPSFYSDKDEVYQFPLNYNDIDSSTFAYTLSLLTLGSISTEGQRINTVDGWGQVITPFGSFNALKVTTDIISNDTINLGFFNIGMANHTREVKWLANGIKHPVMQLSGTVLNGQFAPNAVEYRDSFRIIVNPLSPFAPTASFQANNLTPTTADTVVFSNNSGFVTGNQWVFTPNTVTFVNGTSATSADPEVTFNVAGLYDVKLTATNFFGSDDTTVTDYINVSWVSGTDNLNQTNDLRVFPNPASDVLTFEYYLNDLSDVRIEMFDVQGRYVGLLHNEMQPSGTYQARIPVKNYASNSGFYFVKVTIGKNIQWLKVSVF